MGYELMMSQPYLLCPRHAACIVDHVCLTGATKQSNASRSGTGGLINRTAEELCPPQLVLYRQLAQQVKSKEATECPWLGQAMGCRRSFPRYGAPAFVSASGVLPSDTVTTCGPARLSSLRILTWAMKASILRSSHASERSPVHEGHPRIRVWRPRGPQA